MATICWGMNLNSYTTINILFPRFKVIFGGFYDHFNDERRSVMHSQWKHMETKTTAGFKVIFITELSYLERYATWGVNTFTLHFTHHTFNLLAISNTITLKSDVFFLLCSLQTDSRNTTCTGETTCTANLSNKRYCSTFPERYQIHKRGIKFIDVAKQ